MPSEGEGQFSSIPAGAARPGRGDAGLAITPSISIQNLTEDPLLRSLPRTTVAGHSAPLLGKIPLLARLGRGAMGAVYYGIHPRLRIEVAVKVLQSMVAEVDPTVVERFYREAQSAARVRSQHLVHVTDVDEEYGLFYIMMEYVRGISVADYIKRAMTAGNMGVPEGEALRIVIAASKGLAAAHAEGIIHRDVKPSNILLPQAKEGESFVLELAKLADLGLARPENQKTGVTLAREALGTPGYMAPEQAEDASQAGKPADVFGMGATLYALLRGRPPFTGETPMAVLSNTIREPHRPISEFRPDVSLATAGLLDRCLSKDPRRRFTDAEVMVAGLRICRDELGEADGGPNPRPSSMGETTILGSRRVRPRPATRVRRKTMRVEPAPEPAPAPPPPPPPPKSTEAFDPHKTRPSAPAVTDAQAPVSGAGYPPLPAEGLGRHQRYIRWPFDADEARRRQTETSSATGLPVHIAVPLAGGPALGMALLPAGEFLMGSPHTEEFREKDEQSHYVRMARPLYIGVAPVTQAQWKSVTGENASRFKDAPDGPQRPIERVSWDDIYAKFLPKLAPLAAPGWQFRLATEAEWEYACRAGTETPFCFGLAISVDKLNCKEDRTSGHDWKWVYSHDMGGGPKERQETTPVGVYPANAWGLLDMHGNVWEWCEDWYNDAFYHNVQAVEPICTIPGDGRVLRGGSWNYTARYCRAASRYRSAPDSRNFSFGFRVVCAMTGAAQEQDPTNNRG